MYDDSTLYDMRTAEVTASRERQAHEARTRLTGDLIDRLRRENEALRAQLAQR